jgi:phosphoglycerate kinase
MQAELEALEKALGNPVKPVAAVVGGAKVSTKLDVLKHLVSKVDHLIIGGGMANTFLAARGVDVGKSLCEHDLTGTAEEILDNADKAGCTVHLPYDVVLSKEFAANPASLRTANVHEVGADEMILDVGPLRSKRWATCSRPAAPWCGTGRWARLKWRRSMLPRLHWRRRQPR